MSLTSKLEKIDNTFDEYGNFFYTIFTIAAFITVVIKPEIAVWALKMVGKAISLL